MQSQENLPRLVIVVLPRLVIKVLPRLVVKVLPRLVIVVLPRLVIVVLPRLVIKVLPRLVIVVLPRLVIKVLPRLVIKVLPRAEERRKSVPMESQRCVVIMLWYVEALVQSLSLPRKKITTMISKTGRPLSSMARKSRQILGTSWLMEN